MKQGNWNRDLGICFWLHTKHILNSKGQEGMLDELSLCLRGLL